MEDEYTEEFGTKKLRGTSIAMNDNLSTHFHGLDQRMMMPVFLALFNNSAEEKVWLNATEQLVKDC